MTPGRAAAALPAKLARARPRVCRCFFHSFKPLLSGGLGAGAGTLPPPPVSASTMVEIAVPIAVRIDAMVIPCSRRGWSGGAKVLGKLPYGKQLFTWLSLIVSLMASFVLSFFATRCLG